MKIGFFSEAGYEGKVPRNHPNMRTDVAWVCALDATHHPIPKISSVPSNTYDVGVMIIPKKRKPLINLPLLNEYKRVCKKVTVMQESYYNYWQDSDIAEQIWYFNFLVEMDLIFCHNDVDSKYYNGLTNVRTELLPTVMITDNVVQRNESGGGVIIGGNWVRDYGGFDSYQVASEITDDITSITTGRMKPEEKSLFKHLPWMYWSEWINTLSQYHIGVQLGTAAAGTFNLNCSYHGIPCIAYSNSNTQKILHPKTTVELGDVIRAKEIARKLKDKDFYDECSESTKENYAKYYSEEKFLEHTNKIFNSIK
tara:strand:+ start:752 stop:1681 length:930 start_codon:yes stop_codon:yes gene_type:complete